MTHSVTQGIKRILSLNTTFTEIKIQLCLHNSSKKFIHHLLILSANYLLLNFISVFFFWMKLSSHYRIKRNSDKETLSNSYTVDLIIIAAMYLDIKSLQSSVLVRELRDFFFILHTTYCKSTDSDNVEFSHLIKTSLKFSVFIVLMQHRLHAENNFVLLINISLKSSLKTFCIKTFQNLFLSIDNIIINCFISEILWFNLLNNESAELNHSDLYLISKLNLNNLSIY